MFYVGCFYNNEIVCYLLSLDSNDGKNMDCRFFEMFIIFLDDGKFVKCLNVLVKLDDDLVKLRSFFFMFFFIILFLMNMVKYKYIF